MALDLINEFDSEKLCEYEGRMYLVRDNGAILRLPIEGKRHSNLDGKWTFGTKNDQIGYMIFASSIRVHRVVCTAFHGLAPEPNMVVDHIDTNRCNNRPENLRWVTRLDNVLLNDITRKKVEYLCGSIDAFLNDPSILRSLALPPNLAWMKTVTKEDAARTKKRLDEWAKLPSAPSLDRESEYRVYSKTPVDIHSDTVFSKEEIEDAKTWNKDMGPYPFMPWRDQVSIIEEETKRHYFEQLALKDALTPGAKQLNWKTLTEFPQCPDNISSTPLQDYLSRLSKGEIFCRNQYPESPVYNAAVSEDGSHISVLTKMTGATDYALAEVSFEDGFFIHKSIRTFFTEKGANKYFTLSLGREWDGGPVLEDGC